MITISRLLEPSGAREFFIHHHTSLEIDLFESGRGTYLIAGKEYPFTAGDIFLFGNNEVHMVNYVDPTQPMNTLKMHFEPEFLWMNASGILDESYLQIFFGNQACERNKLSGDLPVTQRIRELMVNMEWEHNNKQYDYKRIIRSHLTTILVYIIRHFEYYNNSNPDMVYISQNQQAIKKVLNFIEENFTDEITLDDLSAVSNMSKNNLLYVFKRLNGMTPYNYITTKRVNHAIQLLTETDQKVLDISQSCGFNSLVSFYKVFKKYTGRIPTDFRKDSLSHE